jgi:hypothetical protein
MVQIFLCHASEDKPQVEDIYRRLSELGFQPWMDKIDLLPGQRWQQEIPRVLRTSEFILIFFSQNSVAKRGYVQREFKLALDTLQEVPEDVIHTIPVRLDNCVIPGQFASLQWCNLFEKDGFERMVLAIRTGLAQRQRSTGATPSETSASSSARTPGTPDDSRLLQQIELAAAEWDRNGRADQYLWSDEHVVEVVHIVQRLQLKLGDVEQRFLGPIDYGHMLNELADPATPHQRRATIGVRLALMHDPRPGVGLRDDGLPDIVWCEIPGGKVTLEGLEQTISVKPFALAKYPITWSQYRAFVNAADGFYNAQWWNGLGSQPDEPGQQFQLRDNHPAENVSWFDAMAYCRWLSAHLGYKIQLPTEWEWQQAATGGSTHCVYPWGPKWDANCANTAESRLGRTTAVGMYPTGASPVGALDMSGNVWEWCMNEFECPEQLVRSANRDPVTRGGAWDVIKEFSRAGWREPFRSFDRGSYLGFRVVRSS